MRTWLLAWCLVVPFTGRAQPDASWPDSLAAYWSRMEAEFADSAQSPLLAEDRAVFEHLARFAPDPAFVVVARFKPAPKGRTFGMRTSTDRLPTYRDMGTLHFTLEGKETNPARLPEPGPDDQTRVRTLPLRALHGPYQWGRDLWRWALLGPYRPARTNGHPRLQPGLQPLLRLQPPLFVPHPAAGEPPRTAGAGRGAAVPRSLGFRNLLRSLP
ncbi:MAG: DUF1684 domain-containing protein [Flavobacteriales bacterium]|nr:DUF1684 domain-containing protein [Flavobacteriales bacterium]